MGKQITDFPVSTRRHSAAHVLAQAITEKFPGASLAIGPDTEHGFFYDVLTDPPVQQEDLKDLEKRMKKIARQGQVFERYHLPIDEGIAYLKQNQQQFKECQQQLCRLARYYKQ